jgi:tripartite-type tricarboxylate transporter receptor subunit TctC
VVVIALAASLTACGGGDTQAKAPTQAECKAYPAEDITMVIGRAPGGGYDEYGRFMAPLLEKELGQTVVVKNVDGAGGAVAASQVQSEDADGYTIHLTEPNGLGALQIVDEVDYDLNKFTMLGTINNRASTLAVAADSDIETFDDLVAAGKDGPLKIAANGLTSANFVNAAITAKQAGFKLTPVAHESSSEAITSVVRGDTDVTMFSTDSIAEAVEAGDLKALAQFGEEPYEDLSDVPMAEDIGMDPLGGELTSSLILVAPPGLPDCIKQPLTDAVQTVLNGPEMKKFGEKGHIVEPGTPEETKQTVEDSMKTYKQYEDSFKSFMVG